jgi:CRP/FNR family transcriptional regulator, cyclic AMP receptor protein
VGQRRITAAPTAAELSTLALLASLSAHELRAARPLFTLHTYAKDAVVITEGERQEFFHLILSGYVQAFWRDEAGHELRLGVDGPGDHFPDVTLGGEPALASFVALEDMRLASIRHEDLNTLLKRHPRITVVLLMDVVARLRRLVARTKALTMDDVYGRVVKVLLASSALRPHRAPGEEHLTHAEIGQRVGATREMVGRVLRDLAKGGYVKIERGRVTVLRKPPARW